MSDDVGELSGRDRLSATHVEDLSDGAIVLHHQHVGVHNIVDVHVVADRGTILEQDRRMPCR